MTYMVAWLIAAQAEPLSGGAGWVGAGLLGAVLAWLLLKHLPDKDRQLSDLIKTHAAQVTELIKLHTAALQAKDDHIREIGVAQVAQTKAIVDAHTAAMNAKDANVKALGDTHALVTDRVVQNCQEDSRLEREVGEKHFGETLAMLTKIHESGREAVHAVRNLAQNLLFKSQTADSKSEPATDG